MAKHKPETGDIVSRNWLYNLILFTILFLAVIALFHSFVFSDESIYGSDTIQAGMFFRGFYADYFHQQGGVPVWNPYQFCGIPYIDGFHGDTFYPFSKLLLVMSVFRAWGWNLLLHVFIAGITMFFCARVFKRSQMASTLAAVSYMFAAYFISQVAPGHDGKMYVTALFPLTLAFIELAFERKPVLYFSLLALTIGLIILTPHPQMAYYSLWACAFYLVFKLAFLFVDTRSITTLIKPAALFTVAVVVGLAISAIHFYPGYIYVKNYSPRSDEKRGDEWAKSWSMHPEEAVSLIVPEFCGVSGERGNSYWGRNGFKDNSEYAGAVPFLMALMAVAMVRRRKTWFFGGLALFALIYALAGNTWFFYLFYNLIPNVKSTRAWSMIMFLFSFSTAILAAYGLDFVIEQSRKLKDKDNRLFTLSLFGLPGLVLLGALVFSTAPQMAMDLYKTIFYSAMASQKAMVLGSHLGDIAAGFWKTGIFLSLVAAAVWLYSRKKLGVVILWVVIACALVDAYRFDTKFIRTYDPQTIFAKMPLVDYFRSLPGKFRVLDLSGRYLPTNYLPYYGIEEMTSYHGNQPRWFNRLLGGTQMRNMFNMNLMAMTNTRYLLLSPGSPVRGDQLVGAGFPEVHRWQNFQVYENLQANDRAYLVHRWRMEPDEDRAREAVLVQSFDAKNEVALYEDPGLAPLSDSVVAIADTVTMDTYENDYIAVTTVSAYDGVLVLGDNWYPAWKGFVDGREVPVLRANAAFRGVAVPAGTHTVEFKYISETQATGRMLTLFGLLLVAVGIVAGNAWPRRRRAGEEESQDE